MDLRRQVDQIKWWHTIDLGNGVVTPGRVDNLGTLRRIGMPGRLDGKTVLDVGAWDGFYSFEAERRGASRVLATDSYSWGGGGGGTKGGVYLVRGSPRSKAEDFSNDSVVLFAAAGGTDDL